MVSDGSVCAIFTACAGEVFAALGYRCDLQVPSLIPARGRSCPRGTDDFAGEAQSPCGDGSPTIVVNVRFVPTDAMAGGCCRYRDHRQEKHTRPLVQTRQGQRRRRRRRGTEAWRRGELQLVWICDTAWLWGRHATLGRCSGLGALQEKADASTGLDAHRNTKRKMRESVTDAPCLVGGRRRLGRKSVYPSVHSREVVGPRSKTRNTSELCSTLNAPFSIATLRIV